MARVRRNVWELVADPNDKTLEWYNRAIGAMKARPIADHRSWRFQAAVHDYDRQEDPLAQASDVLPSAADRARFWSQCQHNSWFFLPWHRMYLHHFEQIVAAEVVALGGPADWALPYWNFSRDAASRKLPPLFRNPTLSDGSPNHLYVKQREPACNQGEEFADAGDVDVSCLRSPIFASPKFGGTAGFGGPETGFNHGGGPVGLLESTPHGTMHVEVGGLTGWMSAFNTAGLDPIFWLHHANIDRLWEVWLRRSASHALPLSPFWRSGVRFSFRNVKGEAITMTCAEVLDTTAAPLQYSYDDVSDPLKVPSPLESMGASEPEGTMPKDRIPEMVGATAAPFELGEQARHAVIPTAPPAPQALEAMGVTDESKRVYLHIENLTSDKRAPSYDVYLGVPADEDPAAHPDKRVGRLSMFGLPESSRKSGPHAGSGLTFALEVTDLVSRLSKTPGWNPSELPISFVPVRGAPGARVQVGRVSLYVG